MSLKLTDILSLSKLEIVLPFPATLISNQNQIILGRTSVDKYRYKYNTFSIALFLFCVKEPFADDTTRQQKEKE